MAHKPSIHLRPSATSMTTSGTSLYAYVSNLDSEKLLKIAGIVATIGIGSAAFYYGRRYRGKLIQTEKKQSLPAGVGAPGSLGNQDTLNGNNQDQNGNEPTEVAKPLAIRENQLVLKQCPRGRKTPCIAPFPLKLETFLRVHKIKYELDFNGHEPKLYGSPWIRFNTEDITDSQNVVVFLIDTYEIQAERKLSADQRAMAIAYTHLLENHLYWGIALWRWVYDGARSLKEIQLLPKKIQELIPDVCRTVAQAAWFHGIGKMTPAEVKKAVLKDLSSLSEFLGDKEYFLDTEVPTELDCTAFGMLAQFLWNMKGPFHDAILNSHVNLRNFCWRMRQTYWPDWEDCLNNKDFYSAEHYPVAERTDCCY